MRPEPNEIVRRGSLAQPSDESYTTAITLAEVLYGIERSPSGRRTEVLWATAADVFATFADRVLPYMTPAPPRNTQMIVEGRDRLARPLTGSTPDRPDLPGPSGDAGEIVIAEYDELCCRTPRRRRQHS